MKASRYFLIVLGAFLFMETCSRVERDALFESTHRALFKLAMYRKHGQADALFMGTSRTGEALRPHAFLAHAPTGITSAFNVSVQYSSLDILADVSKRIAAANLRPKLAIVEISKQQLVRAPLPWTDATSVPALALEDQAADWILSHSELVRLRKAFVLDSLARFVGVGLLASQFDGSEQFGIDYVDGLLGGRKALSTEPQVPMAAAVYEGGETRVSPELEDSLNLYRDIASALRPARVIFYVPPRQGGDEPPTEQQQFYRAVAAATANVVYDFSAARLPDDDFRDATHMSHKGGLRFSREFAKLLEMHAVQ